MASPQLFGSYGEQIDQLLVVAIDLLSKILELVEILCYTHHRAILFDAQQSYLAAQNLQHSRYYSSFHTARYIATSN
uniref:Uncharacterized protein n=1 Tax=Leersia perrieri TaxID=77586 RepID=A0A0D9VKA6_9ORYZ